MGHHRQLKDNQSILVLFMVLIFSMLLFLVLKLTNPASIPLKDTANLTSSNKVNLEIKPTKGEYAYQNITNNFTTYFKSNPVQTGAIKFTNTKSTISFFTSPTQSFGTATTNTPPISKDNTLLYQNLFPNIDLKYSLSPTRLLEEFIVASANSALKIDKILQTAKTESIDSYQEIDGAIHFFKQDKLVMIIPKPVMYEQNNPAVTSYGMTYEIIKTTDNTYSINKVITNEGKQWLADPDRHYPIIIDLVIDNADTVNTGSSTTLDMMDYSSDGTAQAAYVTNGSAIESGGTITYTDSSGANPRSSPRYLGGYAVHTFTGSGTFTSSYAKTISALVVAGGGSGGAFEGGGGGGGGLVYNSSYSLSAGSHTITVGNGGVGASSYGAGNRGGNSSIGSLIVATGGGGGGSNNTGGATSGGSGGGGGGRQCWVGGAAGTSGQGNSGGQGACTQNEIGGGGGGAGQAGGTYDAINPKNGYGGDGLAYSISGTSTYYAGGGGGGARSGQTGTGGLGGGGAGGNYYAGTPNTGGGSGGGNWNSAVSAIGGSGIVIIRYPSDPYLQSYSEATVKTQGTYALKGVAKATNSLNQTLTRTLASPVDLTDKTNVTFDIRSTRTGSNIKVGIHDSGGTTTEITPNITSANVYQTVTLDISGVSNANKDVIDKIIITIANADADNTFYVDNMQATQKSSLGDTITLTKSATDLSAHTSISFWARSTLAGQTMRFQMGEAASTEQTYDITINNANTWEQKIWDISGITAGSRDAITKYEFQVTDANTGQSFYFDDVFANLGISAPTSLLTQGLTNPIAITTITPYFSAVHGDPDGNTAIYYQIQVNSNSSFTGTTLWDSTNTAMTAIENGARSANITYAGSTLSWATPYYWRIRFTDDRGLVSEWSSTASFVANLPPNIPTLDVPTNAAIDVLFPVILKTTTTDQESDTIQYKITLCTNAAMTTSCQTFDQTSDQTGWSASSYASGTQATYTVQPVLAASTTYYWKSAAYDPAGSQIWSATQTTPYSFITAAIPTAAAACRINESGTDTSLSVIWTDVATNEYGYEVRRSVDGAAYIVLDTIAASSTSYTDNTVTQGHTYRYGIAPYFTGPVYGTWCVTPTLSLQSGSTSFSGLKMQGIQIK